MGILLLLVLSEAVALLAQRQILEARAGERIDDALAQEAEEFRTLVRLGRNPNTGEPFGGDVGSIFDVFLSRNVPGEGETVFTFIGGRPHRSSAGQPNRPELGPEIVRLARAPATARGDVEVAGRTLRYLAVPVTIEGRRRGTFLVTGDLGNEREEIGEAMQVAAGVSLVVLMIAAGLAWVIAGRVLAPLRDLGDTARSITESDLTRRIEVQSSDEIGDLARTFNAMLDRLEGAFAGQRAFVSDAGHELRTPITIIRGHVELLAVDPDERRETVELVTDGTRAGARRRRPSGGGRVGPGHRPLLSGPRTNPLADLADELDVAIPRCTRGSRRSGPSGPVSRGRSRSSSTPASNPRLRSVRPSMWCCASCTR